MPEKLRVAVLMGGPSPEHEVSLATGTVILNALDRTRFRLRPYLITSDFGWVTTPGDLEEFPFTPASLKATPPLPFGRALEELREQDVAFVALHGTFGEDGTLQGLLEFMGVPYTGSTVAGSALAMDKIRTKEVFEYHDLPTPPFRVVRQASWEEDPQAVARELTGILGDDLVVKSPSLGSSVGVYMVRGPEALAAALDRALLSDGRALVEPRIVGREVTCAVLGGLPGEGLQALPPTEILPPEGRSFDYEAKYTPGMTREITPPRMDPETIGRIQAFALRAHEVLGLGGMSRTDMMVTEEGRITLLEVNTIPGMTETSLYPQAARAVGLDFPTLLGRLVDVAVADFRLRRERFSDPRADQALRPAFPGGRREDAPTVDKEGDPATP